MDLLAASMKMASGYSVILRPKSGDGDSLEIEYSFLGDVKKRGRTTFSLEYPDLDEYRINKINLSIIL